MKLKSRTKILLLLVAVLAVANIGLAGVDGQPDKVSAACANISLPTTYGRTTQTIAIPTSGSYRIWSRLQAPDSTANSYYLQIDGGCVYTVGNAATPAHAWTWVNYQDANTGSPIDVNLAAGMHSFTYSGKEASVQLDRVMAVADTSCVPTGFGDNCLATAPPTSGGGSGGTTGSGDTTVPAVTAFSVSPRTVTVGSSVTLSATATDNVGVDHIEFWNNDATLLATVKPNASGTASYTWSTVGATTGSHSMLAKAYDVAGNRKTSSAVTITINPATVGVGLNVTYFDHKDFTGTTVSGVDPTVNFDWGMGSPSPAISPSGFSARWTGYVVPKYSQTYTFYTTTDDGVRLWVNGTQLINDWNEHGTTTKSGTISLSAGKKYAIKMEYFEESGNAVAKLYWSSASQPKQIIPQTQLYPN